MNEITLPFGSFLLKGYRRHLLLWAQSLPGNWIGRRLSLILRRITLLKKTPIIDAEVNGLNLRFYMLDNIAERKFLFMPNFFDSYEFSFLKNQLNLGDTFIDVGANAGIYTLMAALAVGVKGTILAIEPNPLLVERLCFNLSNNNLKDRVIINQVGVHDTEKTLNLFIDKSNLGGSSLFHSDLKNKLIVRCRTLLQILQHNKIKKIDALKIDIEGLEDKALLPFFSTAPMALYPRVMIIENNPQQWDTDLVGGLKSASYKLLRTTRLNQIWILNNCHNK